MTSIPKYKKLCKCGKLIDYRSQTCNPCRAKIRTLPKKKCKSCSNFVVRRKSNFCLKCILKWRKIPENNPRYGENLKGKNNPHYKTGKTLKNGNCKDCKKKLKTWHSKRCNSCANSIKTLKYWDKVGRTDQPKYPREFNNKLREKIRSRDNYTCQNCNMLDEEHLIVYSRHIHIHHIDYNKENCKESNLITLCQGCNIRANYNRKIWKKFYQEKMVRI